VNGIENIANQVHMQNFGVPMPSDGQQVMAANQRYNNMIQGVQNMVTGNGGMPIPGAGPTQMPGGGAPVYTPDGQAMVLPNGMIQTQDGSIMTPQEYMNQGGIISDWFGAPAGIAALGGYAAGSLYDRAQGNVRQLQPADAAKALRDLRSAEPGLWRRLADSLKSKINTWAGADKSGGLINKAKNFIGNGLNTIGKNLGGAVKWLENIPGLKHLVKPGVVGGLARGALGLVGIGAAFLSAKAVIVAAIVTGVVLAGYLAYKAIT
nr:hypothetical protein [Vampirovibrio sp.]